MELPSHTKIYIYAFFSMGFRVLELCVQTINIQRTHGEPTTGSSDINCTFPVKRSLQLLSTMDVVSEYVSKMI